MEEEQKIEFDISAYTTEPVDEPVAEPQEKAPETSAKPAKKKRFSLSDVLAGRILGSKNIIKQWPLALMVLAYSFLLIANRYSIENLTIENKRLQREIDELRVRQIQNRCDYMNATMLTEVSEKLQGTGIKAGTTPSLKITIKGKH